MTEVAEFEPAWASPPGETVAALLRERNISLSQFAHATGQSPEEAAALLEGRAAISISMARRLERLFGASVQFWMSRDYNYRQCAARLQADHEGWLKELPIGDMIRFGWLSPPPRATDELAAALRFFAVPSVNAWQQTYGSAGRLAAFRTSPTFESHAGAVASWLREGERRADKMTCDRWSSERVRAILVDACTVSRVRDPRVFFPKLRQLCASAGIALVALQTPTGCHASGAAVFVSQEKALILVSFRHLTDDHFWFTFFHEIGHLLLHGADRLFVDGLENEVSELEEKQANEFAVVTLIPESHRAVFLGLRADARNILRFASQIGIAPGIVVGLLQYSGVLRQNQLNRLKRRFEWDPKGDLQPRKAR